MRANRMNNKEATQRATPSSPGHGIIILRSESACGPRLFRPDANGQEILRRFSLLSRTVQVRPDIGRMRSVRSSSNISQQGKGFMAAENISKGKNGRGTPS